MKAIGMTGFVAASFGADLRQFDAVSVVIAEPLIGAAVRAFRLAAIFSRMLRQLSPCSAGSATAVVAHGIDLPISAATRTIASLAALAASLRWAWVARYEQARPHVKEKSDSAEV